MANPVGGVVPDLGHRLRVPAGDHTPSGAPSAWSPIEAWGFIEALLSSPGAECLTPTPRHPAVVSEVLKDVPDLRGNLIHDATTAILMREHGIRTIYTYDTDFHRFPFIMVMAPGTT